MPINERWHAKHKMPASPTVEQRIAWHLAHARHCACRPIPPKLQALIDARPRRAAPGAAARASEPPAEAALEVRPIAPADWPAIEELFGQRGACGGCWCMYWRAPSRRAFDELKGERARRAFKALVTAGEARGILALAGGRAVGWCSLGPRAAFPLTETKRSYAVADAAEVWSVNCFFVQREWRRRGVSRRLLAAAVDEARRAGARVLEGYPVVTRAGRPQPGAFVYKGTLSLFDAAGFRVHQRSYRSSPLVRLDLAPRRRPNGPAEGAAGSTAPRSAVRSRDA